MKKIISAVLAVVLCLSFAACSKAPLNTTAAKLTISSVKDLMASSDYQKAREEFDAQTGMIPYKPTVDFVVEYKLDDFVGHKVHLLLIELDMAYATKDGAFYDATMVVDMEDGTCYDDLRSNVAKWKASYDSENISKKDCYYLCLESLFIEICSSDAVLWSEAESYTVLTLEELDAINAELAAQ